MEVLEFALTTGTKASTRAAKMKEQGMLRHMLFVIAGVMALPVILLAQGKPAGEDDFYKRQQIEAQRVESDVQGLLKQAQRLSKTKPEEAMRMLLAAQRILEQDRALPPGRRTELRGLVSRRIRELQNRAAESVVKERSSPPRAAEPAPNVKDELDTIRRLINLREYSAAMKLLNELEKRYANDTHVQQVAAVLRGQTGMAGELREVRDIERQRQIAAAKVMRDLIASATPITGDIAYPPAEQWARISKRAEKYRNGMQQFTEKEKAILRSLNETTTEPIDWSNISFEDALKRLEKLLGQPIVVDENELRDANVDKNAPITVRLPKGVTNRTVLRTVLSQVGLEYVVRNEVIEVMTPKRAEQQLVTRYYYVGDLVYGWFGAFGFGPFGQWLQAQQEAAQVAQLVQLITTTVAPESWRQPDGSGGLGTIVYDPARKVLIIRNRAEVINALGGGLTTVP